MSQCSQIHLLNLVVLMMLSLNGIVKGEDERLMADNEPKMTKREVIGVFVDQYRDILPKPVHQQLSNSEDLVYDDSVAQGASAYADLEEPQDDEQEDDTSATPEKRAGKSHGLMRFGKREKPYGIMRYGKRSGLGVLRYGKRGDSLGMLRYGKRAFGVMRYGKRALGVMRYGKKANGLGVFRYGKK